MFYEFPLLHSSISVRHSTLEKVSSSKYQDAKNCTKYNVLSTRYQVWIRIEIEVLLLKDPYYLSRKGTRDKEGIRLCGRIMAHSRIPTLYLVLGTLYYLLKFTF
jgi:hypothetical protein